MGTALILAGTLWALSGPAMGREEQAPADPEDEIDVEAVEPEAEDREADRREDDAARGRGIDGVRRDGAAARRELLYRDREVQRGTRFPEGLVPAPAVERSDAGAFDARRRGQAQPVEEGRAGTSINATIGARGLYDDNPLLESDAETAGASTEAFGYALEPKLTLTRRAAHTTLQAIARLSYDVLEPVEDDDGSETLESFDQFGGLQFDIAARRTGYTLFGNIANTTTRNALLEDTGRALNDDRTLTYGGGAAVTIQASALSQLQLSGSARRQEVDSDILTDSTYYQAAVDYRTVINSSTSVGVGGVYNRFEPEGPDGTPVNVATALASWSHQLSGSLSVDAEAGAQFVLGEALGDTDSETSVDVFAEAALSWAISPQDGLSLRASRGAEPNALGELRTNSRFNLAYQRQLSPEFSLGLPVTVLFQDGALQGGTGERSFVQVAPNVVWSISPEWGVSAQYRYRLENEEADGIASSNGAYLSLSYFGNLVR